MNWTQTPITQLLGMTYPILQAPMAGAGLSSLAAAVAHEGLLGAIPCASLAPEQLTQEVEQFRAANKAPINLNFFAHKAPPDDTRSQARWHAALAPYFSELGASVDDIRPASGRAPFNAAMCERLEALRPEVVSFHFGLPEPALMQRVKSSGAKVIASATTVEEAVWLELHGCDAIIAQGYEAGGHRGNFLDTDMSTQPGTFALVPQVVDAVSLPVIAAGGIADGRGIVAALALGASAVQIGSAFLRCPQATVAAVHRQALLRSNASSTAVTNVFTGRPARGIVNRLMRELGPLSPLAPAFPTAGGALAPLRKLAESQGRGDFQPLWCGQAAALAPVMDAGELARWLISDTENQLQRFFGR